MLETKSAAATDIAAELPGGNGHTGNSEQDIPGFRHSKTNLLRYHTRSYDFTATEVYVVTPVGYFVTHTFPKKYVT